MTCGVLRIAICLVEVPDADVVCPYIFRLLGRSRPVAVIHEDLRVLGRRGKLHPDERFSVRVPGFNLVRHGNAVLVDEHHVAAISEREIVIIETRDCRLTELDERRYSRRYLRRRQIGGKRNFDIFLEVRKRRGRSLESICRSGNATWPDSRRVGAGLDRRRRGDLDRASVLHARIRRTGAIGRIVDLRTIGRAAQRHIRRRIERRARRDLKSRPRGKFGIFIASHRRSVGKRRIVKVLVDSRVSLALANCRRGQIQTVVVIIDIDKHRIAVQTVGANLVRFNVKETVVDSAVVVQHHCGIGTGRRIAGDNAVKHREFASLVGPREDGATKGQRGRPFRRISHNRRVANSHVVVLTVGPELKVDASAAAKGITCANLTDEHAVPANKACVNGDIAFRMPDCNAAAERGLETSDHVVSDNRVVDLTRSVAKTNATTIVVGRTVDTGRVVGDAAPGNRAVRDERTGAPAPATRQIQRAAGNRDMADRRAIVNPHHARISSWSRRDLLENRLVPALADERDAACHHQLRVDLKEALAKCYGSDRICDCRRVNRGLDYRGVRGSIFHRQNGVGKRHATGTHKPSNSEYGEGKIFHLHLLFSL